EAGGAEGDRGGRQQPHQGRGSAEQGPLMRALIVVVLVTFAVPALAQSAWQVYRNERFGSTAEVPASWVPGPPPPNGDGLRFSSPDGRASVAVSGSLQTFDSVGEALTTFETPKPGEIITYHRRAPSWLVVSGLRSGRIFYRMLLLSCHGQVW